MNQINKVNHNITNFHLKQKKYLKNGQKDKGARLYFHYALWMI